MTWEEAVKVFDRAVEILDKDLEKKMKENIKRLENERRKNAGKDSSISQDH